MQHHLTPLPGGRLNAILDGVIIQKMIKWSLVQWCCVPKRAAVGPSFCLKSPKQS